MPTTTGRAAGMASRTLVAKERVDSGVRGRAGATMARRGRKANRTGRSDGSEQYMSIGYPMARSDAWRSLSGGAVKVWVELHTRYNGGNNGKLSLSLDEAVRLLGLGKATVGRAFKELDKKGFVRLKKRGHWYGRKASEYAITHKSSDGLPATHEWRRWQSTAEANPRRRRRVEGTSFGVEPE